MLETLTRTVAGATVTVLLAGCESCGHVWMVPESRSVPPRCARCRSRLWRGSVASVPDVAASVPPVIAQRHKKERKRLKLVAPIPLAVAPVPAMGEAEPQQENPHTGKYCRLCGAPCANDFALQHHACHS